jgi:hypothetical protein
VAYEALTGQRPETMGDARRAAEGLRQARPDLSPQRAAALAASLALDRGERPATVRAWLTRLEATESHRGVRTALALVTVLGIGLAALVWFRNSAPTPAATALTAILPLTVTDGDQLDPTLGRSLAQAFAEQLQWLPQRVVPVSAVDQVVRAELGGAATDPDTAAGLVAARFGASEVLIGRVSPSGRESVQVAVQLRSAAGEPLRADSAVASTDSIGDLVQRLVVSVFAEGLARRQIGWSPVLPRGAPAVRAYLAARPRLRAGAYAEAVELYQQVIEADSTFAPAYFERTLAEVLRVQPTRASDAIRAALSATRRYADRLDPGTRDLLAGYVTLVADGNVAGAHEQFRDLVQRYDNAPDAWFLLGYVEFFFGPLFGTDPASARYAFERAAALAPEFAAPRGFLGWIALANEDPEAPAYLRAYLAIDSTSVPAALARLADSIRYRGSRAALRVMATLEERPTPTLELIALASASLAPKESERTLAADAINALRARATTGLDRAIAFRLEMAQLLGGARLASAEEVLRDGRRRNVPGEELAKWRVLLAITGTTRDPAPASDVDPAVAELSALAGDPTAQWLAARWWGRRNPGGAARARAALETIAHSDAGASLLARSLVDDLEAQTRLAAGDTTGALRRWEQATRRYQIEEVQFGLVGSLWPLEIERVRVAAARGDHDVVALIADRFRYAVGFMDQVARLEVLPLGVVALQARHDALGARQLAERLLAQWAEADGAGIALRDSVRARVPGL